MTPVTPEEDMRSIMINNISWGAVLAGVVLSLIAHVILNMIGVGVGAATLDPGTGDNPSASSFSIIAAIWFLVAGIIAALIGGYAAGRLAGRPKESTAAWHGLITWAATMAVIFYLVGSTMTGIIGGTFSTLTSAASSMIGSTAQAVAPGLTQGADPFASIEEAIRGTTGNNDPAALRDAAVNAVRTALASDPQQADQARDQAIQALARAQNIPVEQAREQFTQYEQQYRQTAGQLGQQATEAADTATTAISSGMLIATIGLLLGGVAGWFGGRMGTVEPTITSAGLLYRREDERSVAAPRTTVSGTAPGNRQRAGGSRM
jgi:MFS family permease